jgi:OmpA-OmpF porin, OOP family
MTAFSSTSRGRSRGVVLLGGGVALIGLYVAGAFVVGPEIEDDLGERVPAALASAGVAAAADFSGQDGMLRCSAPLADPTAARRIALGVYGVRAISLDASCGRDGATTSTAAAATTTSPPTSTIEASTTTTTVVAAITTTTTTVAAPVLLAAQLLDGGLVLTGAVGTELEQLIIVDRAGVAVAPANVADQLLVDPTLAALATDRFSTFVELMVAMPSSLSAGSVQWDGTTVTAAGTYVDEPSRAGFSDAAAAVGVTPVLTPRPSATAEQAAALEAQLNSLVAAEPILFEKGSSVVSSASASTIEKVAGIAKRFAGVRIVVQGHTDSEGDAGRNLTLSSERAVSVMEALAALGVPLLDLSAEGFGMTQLIVDDDGNEIPEKSRRVVFDVGLVR